MKRAFGVRRSAFRVPGSGFRFWVLGRLEHQTQNEHENQNENQNRENENPERRTPNAERGRAV